MAKPNPALRERRRVRRERLLAFSRQLVLEAAEEVFAARGFGGAAIEEIARRAGVAIATLYNLFGSKEAVFAALVDYRQRQFLHAVETSVAEGADPADRLHRFVGAVFRYFEAHQAAFRVYLSVTQGALWAIRASLGERTFAKYREMVVSLSRLVEAGMRAGAWPRDDARLLAIAAMGCLNGLVTRRYTEEVREDVERAIDDAWRLLQRLLSAPLRGAHRGMVQ